METEYFECACFSDEHTLKFHWDADDNQLYTSVYLYHYRNIFKRIWIAIKYVFGYRSKYGHWDCFIMQLKDAERLRSLLDRLVEGAKAST
jgi:hypothetical protein